jgi:hypothetical protein
VSDARPPAHLRAGEAAEVSYDRPPGERDGETPHECGYCGRPFATPQLLALHHGHAHAGDLTDAERAAFEEAYEAETAEIRRFQLKAAGAVILLYFGFLMLYAVV